MTRRHTGLGPLRTPLAAALLLGLALSAGWLGLRSQAGANPDQFAGETIEATTASEFSQIVVTRQGDIRSMWFLHDDGVHGLESQQDLREPHRLLLPYSRCMFASYLLRPKQQQVLIVGLGGGSMVHFLTHHQPDLRVDVVEIDPVVVKLADEFFGVRSGGKVKIFQQDAFKYLAETDQRYDAIYMDAFLEPSADTDISGVPLRLKTLQFLKDVQKKLTPDGLVVFNVHVYDDTAKTLATIRDAFSEVYVFQVPQRLGVVVVGSTAQQRATPADLRQQAKQLDQRFKAGFSFEGLLDGLLSHEAAGPQPEQPQNQQQPEAAKQ